MVKHLEGARTREGGDRVAEREDWLSREGTGHRAAVLEHENDLRRDMGELLQGDAVAICDPSEEDTRPYIDPADEEEVI